MNHVSGQRSTLCHPTAVWGKTIPRLQQGAIDRVKVAVPPGCYPVLIHIQLRRGHTHWPLIGSHANLNPNPASRVFARLCFPPPQPMTKTTPTHSPDPQCTILVSGFYLKQQHCHCIRGQCRPAPLLSAVPEFWWVEPTSIRHFFLSTATFWIRSLFLVRIFFFFPS